MTYNPNNEEHRERNRKYQHDWYLKNKELHKERNNERRSRLRKQCRDFIKELKESTPCKDCRNYFPYYVMDFDHLRDKNFNISTYLSREYNLEILKEEIDKCELVCANCHRVRTHKSRKLQN